MNDSFVQQRTVPALTRHAIACTNNQASMTMTWLMKDLFYGL
jgi:hypothetical protein